MLASFLKSKMLNRRLQGWMQQLLQYDFSTQYRPGVEHLDADALSRPAGDPWRPTVILQREENEQEQREENEQEKTDELRAAPKSQLVGGDVGTSPTDEKDIKMKKEILSRLNLSEPLSPRNLLSDEPYVCQSYIICKNIVRNVDVLPRRFCWDLLSI